MTIIPISGVISMEKPTTLCLTSRGRQMIRRFTIKNEMRTFTRKYSYDLNNRLTVFQHDDHVVTYTFDSLGKILTVKSQQSLQRGSGEIDQRVSAKRDPGIVEKERVITCPSCGTAIHSGRKFCSHCGAPVGMLPSEAMRVPDTHASPPQRAAVPEQQGSSFTCSHCGAALVPGNKFCPYCGEKIN